MEYHFPRGYFGIGVYHPKNTMNIGTLWRSAHNLGAAFIFTIGHRYRRQASDTTKVGDCIPLYQFTDFDHFRACRPNDCLFVGIEQVASVSTDLRTFTHPERALYLLGAEDAGLPQDILAKCQRVVHVNTPSCLNVAVAGSIVMYDRHLKRKPSFD